MYENIDNLLQLHEQLEVIYVVDGYQATLITADGFRNVCETHGKTIDEALEKLDTELSKFKNVQEMRKTT